MIGIYLQTILRFMTLVLLQVLVFSHIELSGYIQPHVYVLFILLLPFETPGWLLLVLGFITGLAIDLFLNTPGLHSAATVFMAFLRPSVLKAFSPRDGYETGTFPTLAFYGSEWFLKYAIVLVTAHHVFLFMAEIFRMSELHLVLFRGFISSIISTVIVYLSQFFIFRR